MKISIFPKGELEDLVHGRQSLARWIQRAAELDIDGVELYSGFFEGSAAQNVDAVEDSLGQAELVMPMLCASPDFTHPNKAVRQREIERHATFIELARRLGGEGASCRVLTGQRHPGVAQDDGIGWAVEAIETLIPVAREFNVILGLENHYKDGFWAHPEFAQQPEVFLRVLNAIDERVHFGVQFDPSNAVTAGVDSADFLVKVIDRVVTMQASDRYLANGATLDELRLADGTIGYSPHLRHGVIGEGLNDYPRIFAVLADAGYDGWISVEDGVNGWAEMEASVQFLLGARDQYFGGSRAVHVATLEAQRALATNS